MDAIYLLGDFAVIHDATGGAVLVEPPERVRWADLQTSGYPYFAGTLQLTRSVHFEAPPDAFRVRLPDEELMFVGVAQLAIDGRALGVRAWAPYVWDVPAGALAHGASEVTLTLTNTLVGLLEGKRYDRLSRAIVSLI